MQKKQDHIATEQQSFDAVLERYPTKKRAAQIFFSRLNSVVPVSEHIRVLDIGAASGEFIAASCELGYQCEGVEPWAEARLNAARLSTHLGIPVQIAEGTAESIPYEDNSFDVVHANSVIEHVEDIDKSFAEIYRVLKPGGVFWFYTASSVCPRQREIRGFPLFGWYPNPLKLKIMDWVKDAKPELVGYTDKPAIHWFTPAKARRLLRRHGFKRIYDRWELRGADEGGKAYQLALSAIRSTKLTKLVADIIVPDCAYTAVK